MYKFSSRKLLKQFGIVALMLLLAGTVWLATTDHIRVWPVRNSLQYQALRLWWDVAGQPAVNAVGTLQGQVFNAQGDPLPNAWVLVSRWNGETFRSRTDALGAYRIPDVPVGTHLPVAGAPGYTSRQPERVRITAGGETRLDVTLPPAVRPNVTPGQNLRVDETARPLTCRSPFEAQAQRQQIYFESAGQPNQPTFLYTPVGTTDPLPGLLTIYPGPADGWDCASIPLAAAGYAVLAMGPAYSFDLEQDIDEIERLVRFSRTGALPNVDGERLAILGGSYSSLHVLRLLQRDPDFKAALLLGPPTDLFDMRRRLENGTFIPPFGLDQALVALGLPSQQPLRYWQYSGAYHVHPNFPPLSVIHSRSDEVVPYQQSELLVTQLETSGLTYEAHFFDGASHYLLAEDGDSREIYQVAVDFLVTYLDP